LTDVKIRLYSKLECSSRYTNPTSTKMDIIKAMIMNQDEIAKYVFAEFRSYVVLNIDYNMAVSINTVFIFQPL